MVTLKVASQLLELVTDPDSCLGMKSLRVSPGSWQQIVEELWISHPRLASRILKPGNVLAPGFAVVMNDEVMCGDLSSIEVRNGDEVFILVTIAGG